MIKFHHLLSSSIIIVYININKKKKNFVKTNFFSLSLRDSNSLEQNQNLVCYHYTKGQCVALVEHAIFLFSFASDAVAALTKH